MVRVRLVRGIVWDREPHDPGDVLEVTPSEAFLLVEVRRQAVRVESDESVEGLGHRDPVAAPSKRGKGRR
ncbi:MAG: hypothetical protein ABR551_14310 [Gemmatimonadales bacterium]